MNLTLKTTDLVYNWDEVESFLTKIFSDFNSLKEDRVVFLSLIARNKCLKNNPKYSHLAQSSNNEIMAERNYVRDLNSLIRTIYKMSFVKERFFIDLKNGETHFIPVNAMSIYIDPNVKSTIKAATKFLTELTKDLGDFALSNNKESELSKFLKIKTKLMSSVQSSNAKRKHSYVLIDVDIKDENILELMIENLIQNRKVIKSVVETRGGYHILITTEDSNTMRRIFTDKNKILKKLDIDNDIVELKSKNFLTVIPGTLQCGFKVKDITNDIVSQNIGGSIK